MTLRSKPYNEKGWVAPLDLINIEDGDTMAIAPDDETGLEVKNSGSQAVLLNINTAAGITVGAYQYAGIEEGSVADDETKWFRLTKGLTYTFVLDPSGT